MSGGIPGHSEFLQFTALEIAMNQEAIVDLLRRWLSYQGCGPLIPPGSGPRLASFNHLSSLFTLTPSKTSFDYAFHTPLSAA
jgi:hypothetical protein